jgi:very-short-patch-repair endonuclease
MDLQDAFMSTGQIVLSSRELLRFGATSHRLTSAVRDGLLIRVRRDHYVHPGTDPAVVAAVRVGGRLTCVSLLRACNVFVTEDSRLHIHMPVSMSRSRSPHNSRVPLGPTNRSGVVLHWSRPFDEYASARGSVSLLDALAQAIECQEPWHALASIDSALHQHLIASWQLDDVFARLPARLAYLRELVDSRAEAGQETVLRMLVRELGLDYEIQVTVPAVGRVDILVEGRLVLEADSRLAHHAWEQHVEDRRRDLALASQGLMSLRPTYEHTMRNPALVKAAISGLLPGSIRNS